VRPFLLLKAAATGYSLMLCSLIQTAMIFSHKGRFDRSFNSSILPNMGIQYTYRFCNYSN